MFILYTLALLAPAPELIETRQVWDRDPHSAFTDLIRFDGQWVCAFRVGEGHVSPDGAIQVLTSADGQEWKPAARLTSETADLRDPKLCVTPDGRLMLTAAAALHPPAEHRHQTMAWFSTDAEEWGEPTPIGEPDFWLWRVTWHDGTAYSVGYHTAGEKLTRLYSSKDGKSFDVLVPEFLTDGAPNEATLRFHDGTAYCLMRREEAPGSGMLGTAKAPFTEWDWKEIGPRVGGPNFIRLPGGDWVAAVRLYQPRARTVLGTINPGTGTFEERLELPSGGDTSYAGLAWHDDVLWVSYYSSHEGKTAIYLAQVKWPTGDD